MEAKQEKKLRRKMIGGAHYVCDVLHDGKIVPFPIVPEVSKTKAESKNENVSELRISNQLKGAIKKAREAKNLSQAQFAEMIQEKKQVVKEYEYGHPLLNHKIISKMAIALGAKLSGPISNERTSFDIEKSIDTGNLTLGQLAQVIKPPVIKETETDKAIRLLEIRSKMKARLEEAQLAGSIGKGKPQQELFGIEIPVADVGVSELKKSTIKARES